MKPPLTILTAQLLAPLVALLFAFPLFGANPLTSPAGPSSRTLTVPNKTGTLNVRDFGAMGDGLTDDTEAIQKCLLQAASPGYLHSFHEAYCCTPEVFFPEGTYLISRTLLLKECGGPFRKSLINLRGEGATIKQANPDLDILYFRLSWRHLVEGLTFDGGKRQIKLWSKNLDQGHVTIRNCVFKNSSGYAIDDQIHHIPDNDRAKSYFSNVIEPYVVGSDSTGLPLLTPVDEEEWPICGYVSTLMHITDCSFIRCMHVLSGWADWIVFENSSIETHPEMVGPAIISSASLMLENVTALGHSTAGKDQWWITMDPQKQPEGWVGVDLQKVKLTTDSETGWCAIRNKTKFQAGAHSYIIADSCEFHSAGSSENCVIELAEAPNLINVRNCVETSGKEVKILGLSKPIAEDYFQGQSSEIYSYAIDENNRSLIASLPEPLEAFNDAPLPANIADRFKATPSTVTLASMREKIGRSINLMDFGAKGDGKADDSEAFRAALVALEEESVLTELLVPNGLYLIGQPVALSQRLVIRGLGRAFLTVPVGQKGPVFSAENAEHLVLQNLHFFKSEEAIHISTKKDRKSEILIDSCGFDLIGDCAITCLSGDGIAGERNQTSIRITDCTLIYSRALVHNAQSALLDSNWITTDPDMVDSGVVINKGNLQVKGLCGVPQSSRTGKTKGKDKTETKDRDMRWIDNYGLCFADRCRFGGEDKGLPPVVNFSAQGQVFLQNSWVNNFGGNAQRITVVDCEEIPQLIALRGNLGWPRPQMMVTVRPGANGSLQDRFFESGNTAAPWVRDLRPQGKPVNLDSLPANLLENPGFEVSVPLKMGATYKPFVQKVNITLPQGPVAAMPAGLFLREGWQTIEDGQPASFEYLTGSEGREVHTGAHAIRVVWSPVGRPLVMIVGGPPELARTGRGNHADVRIPVGEESLNDPRRIILHQPYRFTFWAKGRGVVCPYYQLFNNTKSLPPSPETYPISVDRPDEWKEYSCILTVADPSVAYLSMLISVSGDISIDDLSLTRAF